MIKVTVRSHAILFEVESVEGEPDELVFINLPTTLKVKADEVFSAGTLALNLQTKVEELPGPQQHLWAACYRRFGWSGAQAGLVACPYAEMRGALKELTSAAPGVPHSPLGGPWALDSARPSGSYLFGVPTEKTVDSWIDLCRLLGFTQIDFCGSLNYGDYEPFRSLYPDDRVCDARRRRAPPRERLQARRLRHQTRVPRPRRPGASSQGVLGLFPAGGRFDAVRGGGRPDCMPGTRSRPWTE